MRHELLVVLVVLEDAAMAGGSRWTGIRTGRDGLPAGLQAMGPSGGDLTTIKFAELLGREVEGYQSSPAFA